MAQKVKVAKVEEIPSGRVKVAEIGDYRIAICNVKGEFFAIDDVCTHDGGPLDQGELLDHLIECPRHGARFDVRTGRPVTLPAVIPVNTYKVTIEGQEIYVELPEE